MSLRVLAVSPHLDDAAFSCGGTLAQLADDGATVTVATIFTWSVPNPSGFALACQLDKGLDAGVDYMALRRDEDAAAMAVLGARPVWLDLPEAPHRGYHDAKALFAGLHADDRIEETLAERLDALFAQETPDLVLAPQAIGAHVDHVATVCALRTLDVAVPILWWRDFPYVARSAAAQPFETEMSRLDEVERPIDVARKRAACEAYASQLGFQFGGGAGLARRLDEAGALERFRKVGALPRTSSKAEPLKSNP